jgi:hypothetical protein
MTSRVYDRALLREFARWLGEMYDCSPGQLDMEPIIERFVTEREEVLRGAANMDRYCRWKLHRVEECGYLAVRCDECGFWSGFAVHVLSPSLRLEEEKAVKDGEGSALIRWEANR